PPDRPARGLGPAARRRPHREHHRTHRPTPPQPAAQHARRHRRTAREPPRAGAPTTARSLPMIRTVADRIASSTRPSYRGRHRAKPGKPATAPRTPPPEAEQAERDRRPEAE